MKRTVNFGGHRHFRLPQSFGKLRLRATMLKKLRRPSPGSPSLFDTQVSAQLSEKQNELNRLEEMERNKRLVIRQLEEEGVQLRSSIDSLSMTVRALTEDEQAKVNSIASLKEQYHSTNNKLVEKEIGLRQNIDFLEVCRERLEADYKAATEEKDVLSQAPLAEKQIVNSILCAGEAKTLMSFGKLLSDANPWRTYHYHQAKDVRRWSRRFRTHTECV
ncbi:hypothetical protein MY10362_009395 [Beauveria mimosiformis]